MKLSIKQTLNHMVALLNGQEREKKLRKLESQIEQASTEAELNKLNESVYHSKMNQLHLLQYNYMIRKGKYYQFGIYDRGKR